MIEDYRDPEVLRRLYWDEGLTFEEMGQRLFCSGACVEYHMKKHGIPRRRAVTRPPRARVRGRYMTADQISAESGVDRNIIKERIYNGWYGEDLFLPAGGRRRHGRLS